MIEEVQALLGEGTEILTTERVEPWAVYRCAVRMGGERRNVVVKALRSGTADTRTDPRQVRTERAALELLAQLGFARSPRLIASDLAANLLVLEDLAPREPLHFYIVEHGLQTAEPALRAFARAMGELHALTAGKSAADLRPAGLPFRPEDWERTYRQVASLGCEMSAAAEREWNDAARTLTEPGPFRALSNGDPQANNFLTDGCDGVLIDFEFARFRHVAVDIASIHVPGPAWMRIDCPLVPELEREYRTAVAQGIAQAGDDRLFWYALGAGCAISAAERLIRFDRLDRRAPGERSRLQMTSTVESAAAAIDRHRALPALAGWLWQVGRLLRRRWPDSDVDLAAIPAYTLRG